MAAGVMSIQMGEHGRVSKGCFFQKWDFSVEKNAPI